MKRIKNLITCSLLAVLTVLPTINATADVVDDIFNDPNSATVIQTGPGTYRFKILIYAEKNGIAKTTEYSGFDHPNKLIVEYSDGGTMHSLDIAYPQAYQKQTDCYQGTLYVRTIGTTYGYLCMENDIKESGGFGHIGLHEPFQIPNFEYSVYVPIISEIDGSKRTYLEFEWHLSPFWHDKTDLHFIYERHMPLSLTTYDTKRFQIGTGSGLTGKLESPQIQSPMIATDMGDGKAQPGHLLLVCTSTDKIRSYKTPDNNQKTLMEDYVAYIYTKASDTVNHHYHLETEVEYNNDKYLSRSVVTNDIELPAYHKIHRFESHRLVAEDGYRHGEVELTWKVAYPYEKDILPSDMFEIQRATKPDFADATSIGLVYLQSNPDASKVINDTLQYTYVDDTYTALHTPELYYRIRRASASMFEWGTPLYDSGIGAQTEITEGIYQAPIYYTRINDNKLHEVSKDATWDNTRRVKIYVQLWQDKTAQGVNKYWFDKTAPVILSRHMYTPTDTSVVEIVIPEDSIHVIGNTDSWAIEYTDDGAIYPCSRYFYTLKLDTASSMLHPIDYYLDDYYYYERKLKPTRNRIFTTDTFVDEEFYFTDNIHFTAATGTDSVYSDFIELKWETTGGSFDQYLVERLNGETCVERFTTSDQMFRDENALLGLPTRYRIVGEVSCSGGVLRDTIYASGCRKPYGSIAGRVTYSDGLGCPGIKISVIVDTTLSCPKTLVSPDKLEFETITNDDGSYLIDSIPLATEGRNYVVMPTTQSGAVFSYKGNVLTDGGASISLSARPTSVSDVDFVNTSTVRFTGRVLYKGTTVPVYQAQFIINGKPILQSNGLPYQTDASGNFSLRVPSGNNVVKVVMKNHIFDNNGYLTINGDTLIDMTENLDGVRFYDLTKVRLIGRMAGGMEQGEKTLGLDLSDNNLGDSLMIVLELDGDNISQLIYDPVNISLKENDTIFQHLAEYKDNQGTYKHYSTRMLTTQKRITVWPDTRSGEYQIDLLPVRYKVISATAKGYATLFPSGTTSQTLDLTHKTETADTLLYFDPEYQHKHLQTYNETYSVIYRSPVSLTYNQMLYGQRLDYLGEKSMVHYALDGSQKNVDIVLTKDRKFDKYLFGYPVFNTGKQYTLEVSAHEDYYYNNDPYNEKHETILLKGAQIRIYNGLCSNCPNEFITTNAVTGLAYTTLNVNNPTFDKTGDEALRQVEMSVNVNGFYVNGEPIKAFVQGYRNLGKDVMEVLSEKNELLDILRDPQGQGSYSYMENGSQYSTNYHSKVIFNGGVKLGFTLGASAQQYTGIAVGLGAMAETGIINNIGNTFSFEIPITMGVEIHNDDSYTFTTRERIETSHESIKQGANSDVYVGYTDALYLMSREDITIIDDSTWNSMQLQAENGSLKLLAKHMVDSVPYYLVMSHTLVTGMAPKATFAYTQSHITSTLIPQLINARNALLKTGTESELKSIANQTGKRVYRALVNETDRYYGLKEGIGYMIIDPDDVKEPVLRDSVDFYNKTIYNWCNLIYKNEAVKANAIRRGKPFQTYSLSAGLTRSYYEATTASSGSWYFFSGIGSHSSGSDLQSVFKGFSGAVVKFLDDIVNTMDADKDNAGSGAANVDEITADIFGSKFHFKVSPVVNVDWTRTGSTATQKAKTCGYVLATSSASTENINVYRLTDRDYNDFNNSVADIRHDAYTTSGDDEAATEQFADFVFIGTGGATRCPYSDADSTIFYTFAGKPVELSAKTLRIDNPTLTIDKHQVSNIPQDQPAVFTLTLANETDLADGRIVAVPTTFVLFVDNSSNPNGLRIMMDGMPVTDGRTFKLLPGDMVKKTIEVYRGQAYDYQDVRLTLISDCDAKTKATVDLSVHYLPVACPVNMSLPVDNWVLNTLSQKDEKGFYIPVQIDGFDVNYENFHHIEFQYKLATEGDDKWVNACSFFADSLLYSLASGNKKLITGGRIMPFGFYGERDPMEQRYDLRAVCFCQLGNEFITSTSHVRSGWKDTRVPQLFGSVSPEDGILGVGENIILPFSEDIAANYLDEDNNFDITGYTNQSNVTTETSLRFRLDTNNGAITTVTRNLNGTDFTIDMMVKPDNENEMAYVSQQTNDDRRSGIVFGQTSDRRLFLDIDGKRFVSKMTEETKGWKRVAVTYEQNTQTARFYVGNQEIKQDEPACVSYAFYPVNHVGILLFGNNTEHTLPYGGCMVEARIWTKALNASEISATLQRSLTGYEHQLLAYYPMNEGNGNMAEDRANGATLHLNGQTWNLPEGRQSIRLEKNCLALDGTHLSCTQNSDLTLSFWFKADFTQTADTVALLCSGKGVADEKNATGNIFFGLEHGNIVMRQNGKEIIATGHYTDEQWHHVTLTVNRSMNAASLYVDNTLSGQMAASDFGALNNNTVYLGQCYWQKVDSTGIYPFGPCYNLNGNIDDILFWNTALTKTYLHEFDNHIPNGREMGLKCMITFSERKMNGNGVYETVYCPYDQTVRIDQEGNIIPRNTVNDRVVLTADAIAQNMLSDDAAPVQERGDLKKMNFTWTGKANELMINLNMLDKEINKRNVFITVSNVTDMAGNPMTNPVSYTIFVDRNRLKWSEQHLTLDLQQGESGKMTVDINNSGGTVMNYYIEEIPDWLDVTTTRGELEPTETATVNFTVNNELDPGLYSAIVYLTDDNGLSEPLTIDVNVKSIRPNWNVDHYDMGETMTLFAQVMLSDMNPDKPTLFYDTDTADIVGAFVNGQCVGYEHITYDNDKSALYMTVYGSKDEQNNPTEGKEITFRLWQASTGKIYTLAPDTIVFKSDHIVGSPNQPVVLFVTNHVIQPISLKAGWNWVSFYVKPTCSHTLKGCFEQPNIFTTGDGIKSNTEYSEFVDYIGWHGTLKTLDTKRIFMFHMSNNLNIGVVGETLKETEQNVILKGGWNYLPYLCSETQTIRDAMAGYYDFAMPGDMIKSYTQFAVMTDDKHWVGSLTHMHPGTGYMLKREATDTINFSYQTALKTNAEEMEQETTLSYVPVAPHNMTVIAKAILPDDRFAKAGDILKAHVNGQIAGEATADENGFFFLIIHANEQDKVEFTLNDKFISTNNVTFCHTDAVGKLKTPYLIEFDKQQGAMATPNPFKDHINFTVYAHKGQIVEIRLYNQIGQCVGEITGLADHSFNAEMTGLEQLPNGVYTAEITVQDNHYTIKLIH